MTYYPSLSFLSNLILNFPKLSLKIYVQIPSFFTNLSYLTKLPPFHFLPSFYIRAKTYQIMKKKCAQDIPELTKKSIYFEVKIDLTKNYCHQLVKSLMDKRTLLQNQPIFLFVSL